LDLRTSEEYDASGFVPNVKYYVDEVEEDRFLGVVTRMKREIEILEENPEGKRSPGRPMCKYDSNIEENVNCIHLA
jgi:hypothetical protein